MGKSLRLAHIVRNMKFGFKHTLVACCLGYVVQAIINNFSPLLYALFAAELGISLSRISILITVNFTIQICMDLSGTFFIDKIGYRASVILANLCAVLGFTSLGILPTLMSNKFVALLISTAISAVGGGLLEVVVSPIVEAMPKEEGFSMSFLHSFYCWGHAGVILLSTLFFALFSIDSWSTLALIWCVVPLLSGLLFIFVPVRGLKSEGSAAGSIRYLFTKRQFWLLMAVMLAAGASELAMAQWASYFAEEGLGVSKSIGDLLGPCAFAVAMGTTRLLFCIFGKSLKIERCLTASFALCVLSYLLTALSPIPALSLLGCAVSGVAVAILWPGAYTLGSEILPRGGTPMFALFALAGDLGCAAGPSLIGLISDGVTSGAIGDFSGGDLYSVGIKLGVLAATIFPLVAGVVCLALIRFCKNARTKNPQIQD